MPWLLFCFALRCGFTKLHGFFVFTFCLDFTQTKGFYFIFFYLLFAKVSLGHDASLFCFLALALLYIMACFHLWFYLTKWLLARLFC
jgi:hypothetical protein